LLADDERALLSVARRSLERLGLRVTAHSTLAGALAALHEDPASYDLIVTDHNMSDGSGLDLVRAARRLRPDVPVVLMSGYLNEGVLRDAVELGVGVFLSKPFSVAQLTASVEQALEGTQAISEPEKR
jgi:DNA-binding NtrC family response regulator